MLSFLIELDLSQNNLTGLIPTSIRNLGNLTYLNLHDNKPFGSIPPLFNNLTHWTKFATGPILNNLRNCSSLYRVRFEGNQLSGNISEDFGIYPNLVYIDLSHNNFHGEIGELQILETLNLSQNELSGSLPSSFNNMLSLTLVDVSYNNMLSFRVPYHRLLETVALRKASFETLKRIVLKTFGKKSRNIENESRRVNNKNLFAIWSFDGKIVHENIIEEPENFRAKHCVGEEGSGIVYRENLPTGQGVAVKKLHASPVGDLVNLKGFTSEIRALTEIRHHNIVKLCGYCSHPRHSFLVYEFLNFMAIVHIRGTHCHAPSPVTTPHTHQINQQYKILNLNL
ncbi:hypothetical protein ACSBR1_021028 [Camellia fascicularis]